MRRLYHVKFDIAMEWMGSKRSKSCTYLCKGRQLGVSVRSRVAVRLRITRQAPGILNIFPNGLTSGPYILTLFKGF